MCHKLHRHRGAQLWGSLQGPAPENSPAGAADPQVTCCSFLCFTCRVEEKLRLLQGNLRVTRRVHHGETADSRTTLLNRRIFRKRKPCGEILNELLKSAEKYFVWVKSKIRTVEVY